MWTGYFGKMKNYPKDKGYKFVSIARFNRFWSSKIKFQCQIQGSKMLAKAKTFEPIGRMSLPKQQVRI